MFLKMFLCFQKLKLLRLSIFQKLTILETFSKTFCDWYLRFEGIRVMYSLAPYRYEKIDFRGKHFFSTLHFISSLSVPIFMGIAPVHFERKSTQITPNLFFPWFFVSFVIFMIFHQLLAQIDLSITGFRAKVPKSCLVELETRSRCLEGVEWATGA